MNERIQRLRQHIHALDDAGVRRTTFYPLVNESLRATKGKPRPIRRALAFAHLLDRVEQVVLPHELIAGSILGMWPLAEDLPTMAENRSAAQRAVSAHLEKLKSTRPSELRRRTARWALHARDHYDANILYDDLQTIARDLAAELSDEPLLDFAEIFRVLENHFVFDYGEECRRNFAELPWFREHHLHLNYAKPLRLGLGGLRDEIENRLAVAGDDEKRLFYRSTLIAIEAAIRFVRRYAGTLRVEAASCEKDHRRTELEDMARVVEAVAENAPSTFREALQLMWLVHIMAQIGEGAAMSFARFDQYMFPFYDADVKAGRIRREQAGELIACMWLKVNEPKMRTVQSLCVSGITPEGEDGTNELSLLCLEVAKEVREPYPNTCVRVHAGTPPALWDAILDLMQVGAGQPQLFNDDVMIPGLMRWGGYAETEARDYYPMGCVEIMIQGKSPMWGGAGEPVIFPALIELVFTNGRSNMAGERGPRTGELHEIRTFDQFMSAYLEHVRFRVRDGIDQCEEEFSRDRGRRCDPFASALVDNCLEKGLEIEQGGAECPFIRTVSSRGLGTAVDALATIRAAVFEQKRLTLQELKDVLDADFAGADGCRRMLAACGPRFGNDRDEADRLAVRVYNAYVDAVVSYRSGHNVVYVPNMFSYNDHVRFGEITGATPDGRGRGEVLSDALGPSHGRDVNGPTALINSITKLDFTKMTGGCAFNVKLDPAFFRNRAGRGRLRGLVQTYLQKGGLQVQINLVGQDTLRAAQREPEKHRDLIVRIAGYCEYFHKLDRSLQEEVIQRTSAR